MKYLKSLIAVVAVFCLTALLPVTTAFAAPVEAPSKPLEILVGCDNFSDQTPSIVFAKAVGDDYITELAKHHYDQDYLDSGNLNFYDLYTQYDFSFDEGQTWVAYTPEWDTCNTASEKSYNRHNTDVYYNEELNSADTGTQFFEWMEDDGTWSNPEYGYCTIPGIDKYIVSKKYNEYEMPYYNFNEYTFTVRARFIIAYRYNDEDETQYVFSDWTESKPYGNFKADDKSGNLLVNGDFEDGMKGWTDPDKCWDSVQSADCHEGRHGRYITWPVFANANGGKEVSEGSSVSLYQDVSLDGYKAGQTAVFNCMICNYDQGDGDMGTASLIFLDKDGKTISSSDFTYRNPNWISRSIIASIPKGAVKARVKFKATLYAGSDVDVYLDYSSLVITNDEVYPVSVSEKNNKWQASNGDVLKLVANNGVSSEPSDFTWYSSYEAKAVVDENGVVTMKGESNDGVFIYATDKKSGVAGVYMINIEDPNRVYSSASNDTTFETEDGATVKILTSGNDNNTVEYAPAENSGKVVVPDEVTVNGTTYKVTEIKNEAFKNSSVTEVTIGKNVTKIGDKAFLNCKSLTKVTVSDTVKSIGKQAFKGCTKLKTVKIGKKVTTIGSEAFSGCTKLTKLTIGASVTTIGDKAFYGCKALKSVTIPAKVTKIGKSAFAKCTALKKVTIKSTSVKFGSKCFKSISSAATVTAPKKLKNAAKLIKKAGVSGSKQTIKVK